MFYYLDVYDPKLKVPYVWALFATPNVKLIISLFNVLSATSLISSKLVPSVFTSTSANDRHCTWLECPH